VDVKVPYSFMGSVYGDAELEAVNRVMKSGWLTTGIETVTFEDDWRRYHDVKYAYALSSCTAALHMSAQLCRIKPGDEVITTPLTFVSTNQAVLALGATPVFVDVDPRTWNIDPERVSEQVGSRTRALFITHLAGQTCDMDSLMDIARTHDLLVVEDCAHAQGATYKGRFAGSFGDVGCFSLHAIKNISTLGEGGVITTNRDDFATKIPWLRSMGSRYPGDPHEDGSPGPRDYDVDDVDGYVPGNVRMTEAQAAVGQVQLTRLPDLLERRREIAAAYSAALDDIPGLQAPYESSDTAHTYHIYAVLVDPEVAGFTNRDFADVMLHEFGVQCFPGLYRPSYMFSLYRRRGIEPGLCPNAEFAAHNTVQLPLYPSMTENDVSHVIVSLRSAVARLRN
jgi:dTDP-4-amino-4,6-dideoxygalactose transaminase